MPWRSESITHTFVNNYFHKEIKLLISAKVDSADFRYIDDDVCKI